MIELEVAERLLGGTWGGEVRLEQLQMFRKDRCFQFQVTTAPIGFPSTVIAKRAISEEGFIADPDSPLRNPSHALLDEWAGLAFLTEIAPGQGLAPHFYGGCRDTCMIVYEDLGAGQSLVEPLMGEDPDGARTALRSHAEATARLHNASVGREARFQQIRRELGPPVDRRGGLGWGDLDKLRSEVESGFALLGLTVDKGFWDDYRTLSEAVAQGGPLRALVHNDSCPDNCRFDGKRVRLFDFEVAGFHHRLLDAVYARMSMPHCYLSNRVPAEVIRETENAYRRIAVDTAPEIADDARFGAEIVHACFYWLVSNGIWRFSEGWEDHEFTWGISTWRQRVFHRLTALAEACDEFDCMPNVAKTARATLACLGERWIVEELPLYPAFR